MNDVELRLLSDAADLQRVSDVLQTVWGAPTPVVTLEMLVAIAHAGGYVCGALERTDPVTDGPVTDGPVTLVGASVGLLARHRARPALHSHVTGLVPERRGTGLGRALKIHQRDWATRHGLECITWTFDPLVRRNAWFNIAVLGADVDEYLPSFYGSMTDAINAGDESDRLHVVWDLDGPVPPTPRDGSGSVGTHLVPTPEDIVALRRSDPDAVVRWRRDTRVALTGALDSGAHIVGFTADGNYVIGSSRDRIVTT